jgi:hypothetical protein
MFFSSRRRRGPDLHLDWKVRIFFLGALLAFIGIGTESQPVVLVAIAVLLVGIVLKFFPTGSRVEQAEENENEDDKNGDGEA